MVSIVLFTYTHNPIIKTRAVNLRLSGKTYSDINRELRMNITKSTYSTWFKNLKLSKSSKIELEKNIAIKLLAAQQKAFEINRSRRDVFLKTLKNKNIYLLKKLDTQTQKLLLSILYLGEGAKHKSHPALSLGSANPNIILFYLSLLRNCYVLDKSKFRVNVQCRYDQDIPKLESYWSKLTKIPIQQFYKSYVDKRSIGKPTKKAEYKGVCVVTYFDTKIQLELELLAESVIEFLCFRARRSMVGHVAGSHRMRVRFSPGPL